MRYVLSNLGQGLRRNLSMHLAVILTLFVSLTLVGAGALLNRQAEKTSDQLGSELEITAYLCRDDDPNQSCQGEVTKEEKQRILATIEDNPEVASYRVESKETAFEKVKELYGPEEADRFEGPNAILGAEDLPESVWITLEDPAEFEGITSAIVGLDGVAELVDQRETAGKIINTMEAMQRAALGIALLLVVSALLLVANTIRLAAFARRKEIGIMRLVGASTLYIALPFLLEALVTAVISVVLAGAALAGFQYFGVQQRFSDYLEFIPWIGWDDYVVALGVVAVLGPVLTLLPTLALTRKYVKV